MPSSLQEIFTAAMELGDQDVQAFLSRTCGEDINLRAEVNLLLRAHKRPDRLFDLAASSATGDVDTVHGDVTLKRVEWMLLGEQPGAVIDRYKLLEVIGHGGHGLVFRAAQEQPVRREVALKVIRDGLESEGMRSRFEAERQTLASLDHPNISKLFDAGTTETGRSYFVMELVPGTPITQYCDERRLPVQARVELYIKVCRAVHHAHQKGIIHRDLKPSNILVAEVDGVASPKVIDFGVSRVITGEGSVSEGLEVLGTPQYMSPEQLGSDQSGADIRSDVYALGAMLYELLSGVPALDLHGHEVRTIQDLALVFAHEPIVPPSRRLMIQALSLSERTDIAEKRRSSVNRLGKSLRQDLDWIVLKAIARERTTRYDSVAALADDLQRHLDHRPVVASPEGVRYTFGRLYRRNKTAMLFSTVLAASLVAGLLVVFLLLIRTGHARDKAIAEEQAKINLLRESYIQQAAATMLSHAQGRRLKAFEAIRAAAHIRPSGESKDQVIELRNQAIACMSIPDVELAKTLVVPGGIGQALFTRNNDRFAYVGADHEVHVVRTADNVQVRKFSLPGTLALVMMEFSPNGRYVEYKWKPEHGSRGSEAFQIWDLDLDRPVTQNQNQAWPPGDFNCRSDQWAVIDQEKKVINVYALPSGQSVSAIPAVDNVRGLLYSPDGERIAILCNDDDRSLRVFDVKSASPLATIPTGNSQNYGFAWNPNGWSIAVTGDNPMNQVRVFDLRTGTLQTTMDGALTTELGSSYSPDGRFVLTGGWDGQTRLWDARHGTEIIDIPREGDGVRFQDSNHFSMPTVIGAENWNLITGRECMSYSGLKAEQYSLNGVISPDGRLLAANTGVGVRLWDLKADKMYAFVAADSLLSVAFSPDGSTLYASGPDQVLRLNVVAIAGRQDVPRPEAANFEHAVAMGQSRDGHTMVWGTEPDGLFVGDPALGNYKPLIGPRAKFRRFLAVSPDGKWAASSPRYGDHFEVWNLVDRRLETTIAKSPLIGDLGPVEFSPDGTELLVDDGGADRWYRVGDWHLIRSLDANPLKLPANGPRQVTFSPDGRLIAMAGNVGETILLNAATLEPVATFKTPATPQIISTLAFSPDSTKLIVTGGGTVTVWDIPLVRHELAEIGLDWH